MNSLQALKKKEAEEKTKTDALLRRPSSSQSSKKKTAEKSKKKKLIKNKKKNLNPPRFLDRGHRPLQEPWMEQTQGNREQKQKQARQTKKKTSCPRVDFVQIF